MTSQRLNRGIFGLVISGLAAGCSPDSTAPTSTTPAALTAPSFSKYPAPNRVVDDDLVQCPTAGFTSIQVAVNASIPGDVIKVCAGLYEETVHITMSLTLLGAKTGKEGSKRKNTTDATEESIIRPLSGTVIFVLADDVIIDGFNVVGSAVSPVISTHQTFSGYVVRNNIINSNPFSGVGIDFNSANNKPSIVERNYFDGHGEFPSATLVFGIRSEDGLRNATIRHNTFFNHVNGAILLDGKNSIISNVIVEKNESIDDGAFIGLVDAPGTVITRNDVVRPKQPAILIAGGNHNVVISHNKISDGLSRGIEVKLQFAPASSNLDISHNSVRDMAAEGIMLGVSSTNNSLLSHNHSHHNGGDGILIETGNSDNTIDRNNMKHNATFDAHDQSAGTGTAGTANTWTKNDCNTSSPDGLCK